MAPNPNALVPSAGQWAHDDVRRQHQLPQLGRMRTQQALAARLAARTRVGRAVDGQAAQLRVQTAVWR